MIDMEKKIDMCCEKMNNVNNNVSKLLEKDVNIGTPNIGLKRKFTDVLKGRWDDEDTHIPKRRVGMNIGPQVSKI